MTSRSLIYVYFESPKERSYRTTLKKKKESPKGSKHDKKYKFTNMRNSVKLKIHKHEENFSKT